MTVQLRSRVSERAVADMVGRRAAPHDFDLAVTGESTLYKPDGQRLLTLVRGALSAEAVDEAYAFLHGLRVVTTANRGAYSASERIFKVKKDGTQSRTGTTSPVRSAVVGYFDRYPRYPFCNCSPLVLRDPAGWATCQRMIREVGDLFERTVPDRWARQMEAAARTQPAYVIGGTPFTTMTVNNTFAGGYHTDAGDFRPGFGVMVVLRRGSYRGCDLVVPAYRVGVDLQDRDVIFFDVHEVHGNTPFADAVGPAGRPDKEGHERISIVFYFRDRMVDCLHPDEELARVKKLRGDLATLDDPPDIDETDLEESPDPGGLR